MSNSSKKNDFNPKRRIRLWVKVILWIVALTALFFASKEVISIWHEYQYKLDNVEQPTDVTPSQYFMGICVDSLNVEHRHVERNQTLTHLLMPYGISQQVINDISKMNTNVFDTKGIKTGNEYFALITADSLSTLKHFIYSKNTVNYVICSFGDSITIAPYAKPVDIVRKTVSVPITSSLYMAIKDIGEKDDLTYMLADVYQWTIDFYGIQDGDRITLIYDQMVVDSVNIGIKDIIAARFDHVGKGYYAIGYSDNDKNGYWDQMGESLKKSFLKAPLKFSRISSKFSNARRHPVLRIVRPHHGVDYAAPAGTPVWAVADGVVTQRSYDGGSGNMIKIKHSANAGRYVTGYLHLNGFAKGIVVGKRVSQGDVIGYVGSTGTSTGPHLDFRIWDKGKAVNPLRMTQERGEPISQTALQQYTIYKDSIVGLLDSALVNIISLNTMQDTVLIDTLK